MEYSAQGTTAAGRYESMVGLRSTFDREAKESSKLTIPSLIPESTTFSISSLGSDKLLLSFLSLFLNSPFYSFISG